VQLTGCLGRREVSGPGFPPEHLRSHGFDTGERLFGEGSRLGQLSTFSRYSGEPDQCHRFRLGIFECACKRQRGLQIFAGFVELAELAEGIAEANQCESLAGPIPGLTSNDKRLSVNLQCFIVLRHPAVDLTHAREGVGLAGRPFQLSRNRDPVLQILQSLLVALERVVHLPESRM